MANLERIFAMSVAGVYPHYIAKAEKKGRTKEEVDQVTCWLTGYTRKALAKQLEKKVSFETFFEEAPALHPNAPLITGTICGYRIEEIEHPLMRKIRYLDKLVDELAKGRPMERILRTTEGAARPAGAGAKKPKAAKSTATKSSARRRKA